tara:strand:+ start:722 stop:955 length:234 start_codon:yes stop_codon:yes gene_type:complete
MDDLRASGNIAGENNPKSKLHIEDVYDILEMYHEREMSINQIVVEYSNLDIKKGTITDIVSGRTWPSIYEDFMDGFE